jgi:Sulfotransferase domain
MVTVTAGGPGPAGPAGRTRPALIAMWSPPRSRSTAFFRMMAQRGDFRLYHEPFSDICAQGEYRMDGRAVTSAAEMIDALLLASETAPVFFKDTTEYRHGELFADPRLPERAVHTFIIRDPRPTIESHYAMNAGVTLPEIGYEHLCEIFDRVREATGAVPAVVDADELVRRPAEIVRAYCAAVDIPFVESALTWNAEDRAEWSRTAKWHQDVAVSSAFEVRERVREVRVDNNEKLAGYYEYHLPFYQKLRSFALAPAPVPAAQTVPASAAAPGEEAAG